jgi:hypothetical protein
MFNIKTIRPEAKGESHGSKETGKKGSKKDGKKEREEGGSL